MIIGSPLAELLHSVTQGLLIPVLFLLLAAGVYTVFQVGIFVSEWWSIRGLGPTKVPENDSIAERWRNMEPADDASAEGLVEAEELRLARTLERTDILARIGPALGLAGTLIPLGPGLAALGQGEVGVLAEALTVAFDTTIVGLIIGAAAFLMSSVRRRWYEGYVLTMSHFMLGSGDETGGWVAAGPATEGRPGV